MTNQTFTSEEICGLINALERFADLYEHDFEKMSQIILTDAEALYTKVGAIFNSNNGWDEQND